MYVHDSCYSGLLVIEDSGVDTVGESEITAKCNPSWVSMFHAEVAARETWVYIMFSSMNRLGHSARSNVSLS